MPAPSLLLAVGGERARDAAVTSDIPLMYHLLKGFHEYLTRYVVACCSIEMRTKAC
jgi:hypothetical protein